MRLRLIGVKDQTNGYRSYAERPEAERVGTIADQNRDIVAAFVEAELVNRHRGDWWYAHAGGLADMQFILEYLITEPDFRISASFSGASAIIVKVQRGKLKWTFVDSYWTLRESLRAIGDRLGFPKGDVDWSAPLEQLEEYNKRDCEILERALTEFEDELMRLGSEMRMTLASCAMHLVKRRYLTEPIDNSQFMNRALRPAYLGGRVEVFFNQHHSGYYYDVNSCYPFAMTQPLPRNFLRSVSDLPDSSNYCYFADLTLEIPEMAAAPLPYVFDHSLFFPIGTFRGLFAGPEIENALACGARIVEFHECNVYEQFDDLAEFASEIYGKRKALQAEEKLKFKIWSEAHPHASKDEKKAALVACQIYMTLVYKLLLNSGYGKFGERPDKLSLLINPDAKTLEKAKNMVRASEWKTSRGERRKALRHPSRYEKGYLHMLDPGVFMIEQETPIPNAHVPIAAYVTSIARRILHEHLNRAVNLGGEIYYCDTDGFATNRSDIPTSVELGGLKLEKQYSDALFHAPKLYYLHEAGGTEYVRAKGFSGICDCLKPLPLRMDARCPDCGLGRKDRFGKAGFEKLIAGQAAVVGRMLRIRELFGKGKTHPEETSRDPNDPKAERKEVFGGNPKRFFRKDGTSRPWDVKELVAEKHREHAFELFRRRTGKRKKVIA